MLFRSADAAASAAHRAARADLLPRSLAPAARGRCHDGPEDALADVLHLTDAAAPVVRTVDVGAPRIGATTSNDPEVLAVLPPDPTTMDLVEAPRILGAGAGLDDPSRIGQLVRIGGRLGASMGATRVVTDRGWVPHTRQIGTTGVVVDPEVYLAFGISGAVQHTAGLGAPQHVLSVNTDLADAPEKINQDAYAAWMFKLKPAATGEFAGLLDAAAYQALADADH